MRRTHRRVAAADRPAKTAARKPRPRPPGQPARAAPRSRARPAPGATATAFHVAFQGLVGEVFRINGRFLDVAGALASDLGITPTHWQIIAIVREKPHTIPAISRRVGLRRQSVQHNITQLLARGLVEQAVNPDHRRASLVRLSADGQRLMAELAGRQAVLAGRFTPEGGLGAAKLAAATTLLRRMREASEAGLGED